MGIANIINNSTTTSGGEIVRELVNSSDGQGLHFDGSAGNIDIASPPDLGTAFSFEFVIKADSTGSSNKIVDFGKYVTGPPPETTHRFSIDHSTDGIQVYSGGWVTMQSTSMLADLKVHHMVLVVDGTTATLFDNGNLLVEKTISTSNIDGCDEAKIGSYFRTAAPGDYFNGTIYRCRFWNKALSSTEVQTAFERADVDFADQYGVATNEIANPNFDTNTNSWDRDNCSTFERNTTSPISGSGDLHWIGDGSGIPGIWSDAITFVKGKNYRVNFTYRVPTGTVILEFGKTQSTSATLVSGITAVNLTATSNTAYEAIVTPTETCTGYFIARGNNNTTPEMYLDLVEVTRVGVVSDYDLAFANPTQSLTVQDRSGAADGTASASGVTQVQPIIQGNMRSLAVTTTSQAAGVPADGELSAGSVTVGKSSNNNTGKLDYSSGSGYLDLNAYSTGGSTAIRVSTSNSGSNDTRLTINSSGNVIIANMPTSASGLASGTLYSDSGTIKIV